MARSMEAGRRGSNQDGAVTPAAVAVAAGDTSSSTGTGARTDLERTSNGSEPVLERLFEQHWKQRWRNLE